MNTVDETVKCQPDGHMNGHVATHAEAEAVVMSAPDPGSTTAQQPSSEQIAKTIDELARLSPLEFAVVKKERAAELGLTLLDLTKAVNERRKALRAKAATEDDDDARESQADTLVRYACEAAQFYSNPNNEDETYALVKTNGHRECWTLKSTGMSDEGDQTEFRCWKGSGEALLDALSGFAPEGAIRNKQWPTDATRLSGRLSLAAPALRRRGITIERGRSGKKGTRWIEILALDASDYELEAA